jgi:hypothetical protein
MSEVSRVAKLRPAGSVNGESSRENVEVAEAIKALQTQLADLRKIVQAAKSPGETDIESERRQ